MTFAMAIALALVMPFEAPLFRVGPLTITTVELALYALLAAWALERMAMEPAGPATGAGAGTAPPAVGAVRREGIVGWLRERVDFHGRAAIAAVGHEPVGRAVGLWLAVTALSALAAPVGHRVPAMKFALRGFGGGLLFFAARDALRVRDDRRWVTSAIVLGAVVSALGAVIETVFPGASSFWHPFRPTTFSVTGLPRPSGPFGYPTIAAMYWEAALPLAIAVPLARSRDSRHPRGWWATAVAALLGVGLLIAATLFSATRSALAVAPVASLVMLALTGRGARPPVRAAAVGAVALLALVAAIAFTSSSSESPLSMRLRWWMDESWYRVEYTVGPQNLTLPAASTVQLPITIANTGGLVWPAEGSHAVHVSYHWEIHDATGTHLDFDGFRSRLPFDLKPGASARVLATVKTPEKPGRCLLRWDLVREQVTWLSERGNPTANQEVVIVERAVEGPRSSFPEVASSMLEGSLEEWVKTENPTRPRLWAAAVRLWREHPLLGVGPDNFRHLYGEAMADAHHPAARFDERTHANSLYFETLADMGIVGVAALGWLLFTLAREAWRGLATNPTAPWSGTGSRMRTRQTRAPLDVAIAVGLGTFFVHGLLDYFLPFTPAYALYWLLMAMATTETETTETETTETETKTKTKTTGTTTDAASAEASPLPASTDSTR